MGIFRKLDYNLVLLGLLSLSIGVFHFFYVIFSIDAIILFLSNKIFLGHWIGKMIFPWFNPHIYLGVPVAFDLALGNLHPFNIFFLFPYPTSFSLWMGGVSLLFLIGYYLLFKKHTQTRRFALFLTLLLFFSGSGIFRANPTILVVIAHYGLFLLSLYSLKKSSLKSYIFPLSIGLLMTLSGHVQFVFYGYLLGFLYILLFKVISVKKIIFYYLLLGIFSSWYYLLSLPLVLNSTRLSTSKEYISIGNNSILQYIELILPYIFGVVKNGSNWGPGSLYTAIISPFYTLLIGVVLWKQKVIVKVLFALMFVASLGVINLPFFRGAGQITVLLHILGLLYIAKEERFILKSFFLSKNLKYSIFTIGVTSLLIGIFARQELFTTIFISLYSKVKHGQVSLFFDHATTSAIGELISLSFLHLFIFSAIAIHSCIKNKISWLTICYVIIEGIIVAYFHCYFIPSNIITSKISFPEKISSPYYRIQTSADVIPYFGISSYMGDLIFRPPFSKEKPVFDEKEQKSLSYLKRLFSYIPSSWIMTTPFNTIQGFNTFMLSDLASAFSSPSSDFKTEYKYIIDRNSLFAVSTLTPSINSISSGHLTLYDPRWENLGVRFFISDRPLKKYKLLEEEKGRYIYDNEDTLPIYQIIRGRVITPAKLIYNDPNLWKFKISKEESGSEFRMVMNPHGFIAKVNGKAVSIIKERFLIKILNISQGELVLYYSPTQHFVESIRDFIKKRNEKNIPK